jgi:hypothetical protein
MPLKWVSLLTQITREETLIQRIKASCLQLVGGQLGTITQQPSSKFRIYPLEVQLLSQAMGAILNPGTSCTHRPQRMSNSLTQLKSTRQPIPPSFTNKTPPRCHIHKSITGFSPWRSHFIKTFVFLFFFFFCFLVFLLFYYSYVHTRLESFLPHAPTPSLTTHSTPPSPPTPSIYSRNYFALISNFVEERI